MKKLTKILSVIAILAILVVSLSVFVSCATPEPTTEDASFKLEIRAYNGYDAASYTADITGTVLATYDVPVKAGQTYVYEALSAIATKDGANYKIAISDTDYLIFTESTTEYGYSWMLTDGNIAAEPNYIANDFYNSYMAYNGAYSNGVVKDAVAGLTVYTIVIDGYDGHTGVAVSW